MNRPAAATVVLGVILGLMLAGAQIMVSGRTGKYEREKQARQEKLKSLQHAEDKAAQIIGRVGREGLVNYLGNKPIARYYLLEDEQETTGFMALHLEPAIRQDGSWELKGKQAYFYQEGTERMETFSVSNDLSRYEYEAVTRYLSDGRSERIYQNYEQGLLRGDYSYQSSRQSIREPFAVQTQRQRNLIMPALLDFFSSVTAQEGAGGGALLALPAVGIREGSNSIIHLDNLWVRPGGAAPPEVSQGIIGGHTVEVEYLEREHFQTILYDEEHQLIWQKDQPEPVRFIRAVSREELLKIIPEAQQKLNQLFRMFI